MAKSDSDDEFWDILTFYAFVMPKQKILKHSKVWVHEICQDRKQFSEYPHLVEKDLDLGFQWNSFSTIGWCSTRLKKLLPWFRRIQHSGENLMKETLWTFILLDMIWLVKMFWVISEKLLVKAFPNLIRIMRCIFNYMSRRYMNILVQNQIEFILKMTPDVNVWLLPLTFKLPLALK